jgi:putative tryptophan/tyrosine transport system substrate-binding protein
VNTPMRRREFITLLGGTAAAWPVGARAQQPAMPVIGVLYVGSVAAVEQLAAFRQGLSEAGFVEGRNVIIEYRFAENRLDRLPEMVAELARRPVSIIATPNGMQAALAAKAATATIPVVFSTGVDPVETGLVASLNRPGGNITGIADMSMEIAPKRVGLLRELLPRAARFGLLLDPRGTSANTDVKDAAAAATAIGRPIEILTASTNREIDTAFAKLVEARIEGLLISPHTFLATRRVQVVTLAVRYGVPTIFPFREDVVAGGLMSYGASSTERNRQAGIYVGRILKGAKPADLPIMRATKFEFVINLQTARTLGLDIPPELLTLADEVLE